MTISFIFSFYHVMQQKQDFFSKQQSKSGFSGGVIRHPQKKSNTLWVWIVVIAVILLGILWLIYKNQIFNQNLPETVVESGYTIGETIQKEGSLNADGDLLTYTHSLTTNEGERFLLKSSTIPLNNYTSVSSGVFVIQGTIVSLYEDLPLVEVSNITATNQPETASWENTLEALNNGGVYISQAGIGFPWEFFDQYAFVGEAGANGEISIKNLDNEKITKISYFSCSNQGDTNCKSLTRTFESTAAKKSTTLNGDTFFKLPEVQSWYFQNGTWRGYFINNADDEEVEKIKNLITITNPEWIKETVNQYGIKTCLGNDATTEKVTSHTVNKNAEGLNISIEWKWPKSFNCKASVDFTKPTKLKLIDLKINDLGENTLSTQTVETSKEKKEEIIATSSTITPSNKQFPVSSEKTMSYNSSRGEYRMIFPSANISYTSNTIDEDFGQIGVRCRYAIKVIDYKNKENIQTSPKVIIYECGFKNGFQLPGSNYFQKDFWDKHFVFSVMDGSWFDFAKNITIESL